MFPSNLPTDNNNGITLVRTQEALYNAGVKKSEITFDILTETEVDYATALNNLKGQLNNLSATYITVSGFNVMFDVNSSQFVASVVIVKWI